MSRNSTEKWLNEFVIVVITNLFVCFLEEKLTWKNPFDFAGPLTGRQKNWQYLPVVSMFIYQTTVDFVKKKSAS